MAEIDVTVAGKRRRLACADGEEAHLERLAAMLDEEARRLAPRMGPVSDSQLLVMAGLMLADRLHEATETLRQAEKALAEAESGGRSAARPAAPPASPPAGGAAQPGLFAEDEAAAALQGAIAALESALARREDAEG
jgi:cell division protein ZapA